MECTSEYTNWDSKSDEEFYAWRLAQGSSSIACRRYPYCSHYGGAFYDPIPPWLRREEARHSDIPKGMARALEDGQMILQQFGVYPFSKSFKAAKRYYDQQPIPYGRMFRHPKVTGKWSTQETLSFID